MLREQSRLEQTKSLEVIVAYSEDPGHYLMISLLYSRGAVDQRIVANKISTTVVVNGSCKTPINMMKYLNVT